jgi:hypothetical protein
MAQSVNANGATQVGVTWIPNTSYVTLRGFNDNASFDDITPAAGDIYYISFSYHTHVG